MAATVTTIAWGGTEYYQAYEQSGQLIHLSRNIKWATDYLLKAFVNDTPGQYVLYGQVGNGNQDHHWWGSAEVIDYEMERPVYKIDTSCPGSDLAAETSAALSSASVFFRQGGEIEYADLLVQKAERLYEFADKYRGKYSDCIKEAVPFYTSFSGYQDELVWGAIWLYRAKQAQRSDSQPYLDKAIVEYQSMSKPYNYTFIGDDKSYGVYVLLAIATGEEEYKERANNWLDYWTIGYQGERIKYTPGGLAFLAKWGSLHLAANTAFVGFVYSDWLRSQGSLEKAQRYFDFGVSQINYILGNNPSNRSYLIGFGENYPKNPHHRTSHGSWTNNSNNPSVNRNLLVGALVGGPDENDQWQDDRNDWEKNEVATGYNAGLLGALARMYLEFGGDPLQEITLSSTDSEPPIYIEAEIKDKGADFIDLRAYIINKSFAPAQGLANASMRFFFTLDDLDTNNLSISSSYNECNNFYDDPVKVSENLYYVEISCKNNPIYPGGESKYKKQIDLRITSDRQWDNSLQWLIAKLTSAWHKDGIKPSNISLYEDGQLIWGNEMVSNK
jgi:hypothetical protein